MPLVLGIATGVGLLLAAMDFGLGAALDTTLGSPFCSASQKRPI
jgi:hypothetical protein